MKKFLSIFAAVAFMILMIATFGNADQTITITKPVIISGTTYTTGNVTVDDATARILVNDGKATYVSAPAAKNKTKFSVNTLDATTGNITTVNATTGNITTVTATTINGTTGTITNLNTSGTATIGTVQGTTVSATTGSITNISTSGTGTFGSLVVTAGTTTTCTTIKSLTIVSGIVTAATCTP